MGARPVMAPFAGAICSKLNSSPLTVATDSALRDARRPVTGEGNFIAFQAQLHTRVTSLRYRNGCTTSTLHLLCDLCIRNCQNKHSSHSGIQAAMSALPSEAPSQREQSATDRTALAKVARNTAATLAGQVLIKVISFAFAIYVVRRLGAEDFGRYSAAMAFAFIFAMLTELGTSALSVREMVRKPECISWIVPDIMAVRAILSLIVIIGVTLSAWLLGKPPDMVVGIFIASLGMLLYAFQGPLDSLLIAQERLYISAALNVLNQVIFITIGTVALLLGVGFIGLLLASLIGITVMGVASYAVVRNVLGIRFDLPNVHRWWSLIKASLPFGLIGLISEVSRRFDVVFMSFVLTYTAVGWYNVPYNLIVMMLLLAQSVALSIYPSMVKAYNTENGSFQDTIQRAMRYLLLLALPMAIGGMLLADRIILLLYGNDFVNAVPIMRIMVWALPLMFLAEILGRISITMHLERRAAAVTLLNALVAVGLNLILIPRYGALGAALVMVVSQFVNVLLDVLIIGPVMLFRGSLAPFTRLVGAGILMGSVVWVLCQLAFVQTLNSMVALLLLVGVGAIVYGLAALALGAVSRSEAAYLSGILRNRLHRRDFTGHQKHVEA